MIDPEFRDYFVKVSEVLYRANINADNVQILDVAAALFVPTSHLPAPVPFDCPHGLSRSLCHNLNDVPGGYDHYPPEHYDEPPF